MKPAVLAILLFTILSLFTSQSVLMAQNAGSNSVNTVLNQESKPEVALQRNGIFRPGWHVNVGSSFIYSPLSCSISGLSVTPAFSVPLTSRISLTGGAMINHFGGAPMFGNFEKQTGMVSVFGMASYQVNDNLLIYGSGIKHLGHLPYALPLSQGISDQFTLGSELKLGDHFTIGATLRVNSTGSNGYYGLNNPWYDLYGPFQQWGSPFSIQP